MFFSEIGFDWHFKSAWQSFILSAVAAFLQSRKSWFGCCPSNDGSYHMGKRRKKKKKKGKPPGNSHRYSLKRGKTNWIYLRYFWFFPLCHNPMQDIWEKRLCSEEQRLTVFFLYLTVHYVVFLQEIFFNALQIGLCNPPVTRGLESQWDNLFYSFYTASSTACRPHAASYTLVSGILNTC